MWLRRIGWFVWWKIRYFLFVFFLYLLIDFLCYFLCIYLYVSLWCFRRFLKNKLLVVDKENLLGWGVYVRRDLGRSELWGYWIVRLDVRKSILEDKKKCDFWRLRKKRRLERGKVCIFYCYFFFVVFLKFLLMLLDLSDVCELLMMVNIWYIGYLFL